MFCVNCFQPKTKVINSRGGMKHASVWRRRHCTSCGANFTTYEKPSVAENKSVLLNDGATTVFNIGKLIVSIASSFGHDKKKADYDSLWLAQTVEDILSTQIRSISSEDIAAITHQTLKAFDDLAAMQYAARHQLITSSRKQRTSRA
ncbi:MAG: hypothetical protein ABIQ04_05180 [Candidatus Saccharimonadales bacterium]